MSKKIIAVLLVATILFMFAFAACNKDKDEEDETTKLYADATEYDYVTDESGNRVLSPDGEILVYVTDEDGEKVTNEDGEPQTLAQQFVPIFEDGKAENYGYSIELPEGWVPDKTNNDVFINEAKQQKVTVTAVNKTYADYYTANKNFYDSVVGKEGVTATWEEDYNLGKDCGNVVRFSIKTAEGMNVMYFFVNNDNLYKILFEASDPATAVADSEAICAAVSYKPYQYFEIDVTDKSDVDESVWESVVAGEQGAQPITSASSQDTSIATTTAVSTTIAQ